MMVGAPSLYKPFFAKEGIVLADAVEAQFIALFILRVEMSQEIVWSLIYTFRLW